MQDAESGDREAPKSDAGLVIGCAGSLVLWALIIAWGLSGFGCSAQARTPPPAEFVRIAHEVNALPPGPRGYGLDCHYRAEEVFRRLRAEQAPLMRQVSWSGGRHWVVTAKAEGRVWAIDGQADQVVEERGEWAGPYHFDNWRSAQRW